MSAFQKAFLVGSAPWSCLFDHRRRAGPLAGKITVITATNDRALALSAKIAGGMIRVGVAVSCD
jgi:hypothetical protein